MTAFFNSNTVQAAAPVRAGTRRSSAAWVQLGRVDAVQCERLSTTVVRRDIFDRLEERGIVRGGSIARCMDVPCGEMVIASDLLRGSCRPWQDQPMDARAAAGCEKWMEQRGTDAVRVLKLERLGLRPKSVSLFLVLFVQAGGEERRALWTRRTGRV